MAYHPRILTVDASPESRDILQTLLQRQGAETLVASGVRRAAEMVKCQQPDMIVLDEDSDLSPAHEATRDLEQTASRSAIPIVVLGTARRHFSSFSKGQLVTKPYHYGPLIRRIEELLGK